MWLVWCDVGIRPPQLGGSGVREWTRHHRRNYTQQCTQGRQFGAMEDAGESTGGDEGSGRICRIYGLSPVVWLQLGWCIISLRWWSFHTQLEMPPSWRYQLSAHACVQDIQRDTPTTAYISPWMYLYFRIYKLLPISISTGCEPGYRYYLNSHDVFHDLQKEPQEP